MYVLRKMRAIAGVLLLSPGLSVAADQAAAAPDPQALPGQTASGMTQAIPPPAQPWTQMMPFPGMPPQYWMQPQGMMWPMQPQYPVPMGMPPMPSVPWVPVMWVMVPVPAETPGVTLPPSNKTAPLSGSKAVPPTGAEEGAGARAATISPGMPAALPTSAVPAQEAVYVPVAPAPVVKLPVPDAAPTVPADVSPPASGGADAGKVLPDQAVSPVGIAIPAPPAQVVALAAAAAPALPALLESALNHVSVDYGPVAPTPVVDLLALLAPDKSAVKIPARSKKSRKASVAIPLKPRSTATAKPVKPRMCWTQGVVAPCR